MLETRVRERGVRRKEIGGGAAGRRRGGEETKANRIKSAGEKVGGR